MYLCRANWTFRVNQIVANEGNDHADGPCEYWTDRRLDERQKDEQAGRQTDSSPLIRELQMTLRKKEKLACNSYLCLIFSFFLS